MSGDAFKLNSGSTDFNGRQKKVFDQLLVLESNRSISTSSDLEKNEPRTTRKEQKRETRHFRGRESIFKKPQNPAPKNYIKRLPDFKKNPHKWTKYSLEDVQEITDESNTKSAMDFLRELANRRKIEQGIIEEKLEELPSKIVFNKHVRITSVRERSGDAQEDNTSSSQISNCQEEKASFSSSKRVMPEYVIGQKPVKKDRQHKKTKPEKGKQLKLDHLAFEDD